MHGASWCKREVIFAAVVMTAALGVAADAPRVPAGTNVVQQTSAGMIKAAKKKAPKPAKASPKQLSGAELYAVHCNRCHPERYAPERTDVQWETILMHMRVRANLPAKEAKAILKYLQEDSGK